LHGLSETWRAETRPWTAADKGLAVWLFALLVAGNLASTLLECGVGSCADNPTYYDWVHG